MDYKAEIVDPGDRFSKHAREISVGSFENSPALNVVRGGDGMRAMDGFAWHREVREAILNQEIYEVSQSDGAGGKPQFFTLCNTPDAFANLGWEVITMNADDLACRGGLPVMLSASNINVKRITDANWHLCEALLDGFGTALRKSKLVLMTGETAVMKHSVTAFCDTGSDEQLILTWDASCLGLASTTRKPNGSTITPGMVIVGFKDRGYRCNGGTKFTNIILDVWGPNISTIVENPDAQAFVEKLVVPSRSYAQTVARLNGWWNDGYLAPPVELHGAAHITGGGVWSKLAEILPDGVGADLDSMPAPTPVLREAQLLSRKSGTPMSDYECYGTFHGGCGMMLICNSALEAMDVCHEAHKDGHDPYIIGRTIESPENEIRIRSQFADGGMLSSLHPE